MRTISPSRAIRLSIKIYERALVLYPKAHREQFGPLMVQLFREQCRDAYGGGGWFELLKVWCRTLLDLIESSMFERITATERSTDMKQLLLSTPRLSFAKVFVFAFLLVVTVTSVVTFTLPKFYVSNVRMKVDKGATGPESLTLGKSLQVVDPYFVQTELETIQSKSVLYRVIEELGLNRRWALRYGRGKPLQTPQTLALLKRNVFVQQLPNSHILEINVFSQDPWEAPVIANKIAEVYRSLRVEDLAQNYDRNLQMLQNELAKQSKKVEEAQATVESVRKKYNLSDLSEDNGHLVTPSTDTIRRLEGVRAEVLAEYVKMKTLFELLQSIGRTNRAELRKAVPIAYPTIELTERLRELANVEQKLGNVEKQLNRNHPEVTSLTALRATIEKQVEDLIDGVLTGLEARARMSKTNLDKFDETLAALRKQELENQGNYREYFVAKRDLEAQQQMRTALQMKITQERIDQNVPKSILAEIIDPAELHPVPVRPNIPRNLMYGLVGGLVAGAILGFATKLLQRKTGGGNNPTPVPA